MNEMAGIHSDFRVCGRFLPHQLIAAARTTYVLFFFSLFQLRLMATFVLNLLHSIRSATSSTRTHTTAILISHPIAFNHFFFFLSSTFIFIAVFTAFQSPILVTRVQNRLINPFSYFVFFRDRRHFSNASSHVSVSRPIFYCLTRPFKHSRLCHIHSLFYFHVHRSTTLRTTRVGILITLIKLTPFIEIHGTPFFFFVCFTKHYKSRSPILYKRYIVRISFGSGAEGTLMVSDVYGH